MIDGVIHGAIHGATRRWAAALAACGLLAVATFWLLDHVPAGVHAGARAQETPAGASPNPNPNPNPPPDTALATSRSAAPIQGHAPPPDAERLLRELEPLAVSDKPRALALALAADSQLSDTGVLAEARRALIVTLLVDIQRLSTARERARHFIRQYPHSRYLPLVKGVTGIHPRPRPSEAPR